MTELSPRDVLVDLLGGADFDHEIQNPGAAASIILERLRSAGFKIVPAETVIEVFRAPRKDR